MKQNLNCKGEKDMRKKAIIILFIFAVVISTTACEVNNVNASTLYNRKYSEYGTNYFDKANIDIHTEVITVDVLWWYDYPDNETIIIGTKDGKIYYTHNRDCTLFCTESPMQ